jgi:hypothetical protein
METVTTKMRELLQGGQNLVNCGEFRIDRRAHGFIQNIANGEIMQVHESKDDIDDSGNPNIVVVHYNGLEDFIRDFISEG